MSTPQQPELRRSGETPSLNPDAIEGELAARDQPGAEKPKGAVPKANKPNTPSGPVQDKPNMDAFAAKLGIGDEDASPSRTRSYPLANVAAEVAGHLAGPTAWLARQAERLAEALESRAPKPTG